MRRGIVIAAAAVVLGGCGGSDAGGADVVATTTQLADMARQVGRGRAEVRSLLEPNSDPHGYEPRPSDVRALTDARVVLRSGGEVDDWLRDLVESSGGDAEVVDVGAATRPRGDDPHWWQDPRNAVLAVEAIRRALTRGDPAGREEYARNAAAYSRRLRALDAQVAACVARVPRAGRKLVTTHDALGHFAGRYGLEVVGVLIPSRSTQAQPSSGETAELVRQIEDEGVRAIFPESSLDPDLERAVARETGARVGDPLWADTLGPEGSDGAGYVESIASNTEAIVSGLTGGRTSCRPGA